MRNRAWLGQAIVIGCLLAANAGCETEEAPSAQATGRTKPRAAAHARSSALTKKLTGATKWRIYEGHTQVVALGFDESGNTVDGLRYHFVRPGQSSFTSFETLRHGAALSLDGKSHLVHSSLAESDQSFVRGAVRVLDAWSKRHAQGGSSLPSGFVPFADEECSPKDYFNQCAELVRKCFTSGGIVKCVWTNWDEVQRCLRDTWDKGSKCLRPDASDDASKAEDAENPVPDETEQPSADEAPIDEASEEAEAIAEDPQAPAEDQIDETAEQPDTDEPEEANVEDDESETQSLSRRSAHASSACGTSRVLSCGTAAECRCVRH